MPDSNQPVSVNMRSSCRTTLLKLCCALHLNGTHRGTHLSSISLCAGQAILAATFLASSHYLLFPILVVCAKRHSASAVTIAAMYGQYSSPRTRSHCGSKLVPKLQNPTWLEGGICSPLPTAKLYVLYTMLAMIMICCPAGQAGGTPPCLACSLPCAWAAQPGKLQGPLPTLHVLQARAKSLLNRRNPDSWKKPDRCY